MNKYSNGKYRLATETQATGKIEVFGSLCRRRVVSAYQTIWIGRSLMSEDLTGTIRRQRHSSGESSIWVLTVSGWVLIYSTVTRIAEQLSVENSRVVGSIPGTPAYTQEMKRRSSGSDNGGDL